MAVVLNRYYHLFVLNGLTNSGEVVTELLLGTMLLEQRVRNGIKCAWRRMKESAQCIGAENGMTRRGERRRRGEDSAGITKEGKEFLPR